MPMTPAGWRLVPVEATEEQEHAAAEVSLTFARAIHSSSIPAAEVYSAMVAAAPDPLQDEPLVEMAARTAYDAYYESLIGCCEPSWDELPESHRERMRQCQKAVLALFRGEGT